MMGEENVYPKLQTETHKNDNSRQSFLAGSHIVGGGIAFNIVASSLEPQMNAPVETEKKEEEEKSEKREAAQVAVAENMSGVRKKLLIPAEEALDSTRVAAELVMKDAMEALQRTKQRLMEILHFNSSTQAPPPTNQVSKASSEDANPCEEDDQRNERTTAKDIGSIFSEPTMGFLFPLQRSERINSRL